MIKNHENRLESLKDRSNQILEYMYYFEILFPRTKEYMDNPDYMSMTLDILDQINEMTTAFGFLLENKGNDYQNEKALEYVENMFSDLDEYYPIEIEYTDEFMSWVEKHR